MKKKDPLAVELGKRGGKATAKKFGRSHFVELAKKKNNKSKKK